MIRTFHCKHTEELFLTGQSGYFPADIHKRALKKLLLLDSAISLQVLGSVPGNRLERLAGDRAGQWSIRINDQWRICFLWEAGAERVEITDYH